MLSWILLLALPGLQSAAATSLVDEVSERLRNRIEADPVLPTLEVQGELIYASIVLPRFYQERLYRPAWIGPEGPLDRVDSLVDAIRAADREGLRPEDYHLASIESLLAVARNDQLRGQSFRPRVLTDLELALTDAFLVYGAHLVSGRVHPERIESEWRAYLREADLARVLEEALATHRIRAGLRGLRPSHPGYERLRATLARYRDIERRGGWPMVSDGPKLEEGASGERVELLRRRLLATGDLPSDAGGSEAFDGELRRAVERFQARHGLEPDGVVGPRTLAAMNVGVSERVRQIALNLERWRWLPQDLGRRYLLVNIPRFELEVIEEGKSVTVMRAVVGRPYRKTPVFTANVTYLVLSPYWHVPPTIAAQDVLPALRRDAEYLAKQNMKVFQGWGADAREIDPSSVDWSQVSARSLPYRFRQEPGPANALGQVKFMFPNEYNVYLHDTPTRELFGRAGRAFSSGCVRIEQPIELAEYLLGTDARWSRDAILAAVHRGVEQAVRLPESLPVHLLYWTSWTDPQRTVHFRVDIYERDAGVMTALNEPPPRPERAGGYGTVLGDAEGVR